MCGAELHLLPDSVQRVEQAKVAALGGEGGGLGRADVDFGAPLAGVVQPQAGAS